MSSERSGRFSVAAGIVLFCSLSSVLGFHIHRNHIHASFLLRQRSVPVHELDMAASHETSAAAPRIPQRATDHDILPYGDNPTIATTALAHTLWRVILRPGVDSAIDATSGNGGDAAVLAELLFPSSHRQENLVDTTQSHLVCIDIQREACMATQQRLGEVLPEDILSDHVSIHHSSHTPLALPPPTVASSSEQEDDEDDVTLLETGPVALVVYNLGYLPGQDRHGDRTNQASHVIQTKTQTTLSSLADAALCLRVGGVISIMTYPQSNPTEAAAVQALLEGMALYASKSIDWRTFLGERDSLQRYPALSAQDDLLDDIRRILQNVYETQTSRARSNNGGVSGGGKNSRKPPCWRVHIHEKLGWSYAPRLLTAARVR